MHSVLQQIEVDYSGTMSLNPFGEVFAEDGDFPDQGIDITDDGDEEVTYFTEIPEFVVSIPFNRLTRTDIEIIIDFYFDVNKANAKKNSFRWIHPKDGYTYAAKFDCILNWKEEGINNWSASGVVFKIIGIAISTGTLNWIDDTGVEWVNDTGLEWVDA